VVGEECRKCKQPFHHDCFIKEHIRLFIQFLAFSESGN
jgi:hypothetical protein